MMYRVTRYICLFTCMMRKCPKFTVILHNHHQSIPPSLPIPSSLLKVLQRIRFLREIGEIS
jgi:hypothetical protein